MIAPRADGQEHARAEDRPVESPTTVDANGSVSGGDDSLDAERYRLVSIDVARAPEHCAGEDWMVYRIAQGKNGITGYRQGSLEHVRAEVQSIVTALNGRRLWTKTPSTSKSHRRSAAAARRRAAE